MRVYKKLNRGVHKVYKDGLYTPPDPLVMLRCEIRAM